MSFTNFYMLSPSYPYYYEGVVMILTPILGRHFMAFYKTIFMKMVVHPIFAPPPSGYFGTSLIHFCICHLSLENSSITVLYMSSFCKIVVSLSVRWRYELYHRFYENDKALSCNTTFLVRYFVINICS